MKSDRTHLKHPLSKYLVRISILILPYILVVQLLALPPLPPSSKGKTQPVSDNKIQEPAKVPPKKVTRKQKSDDYIEINFNDVDILQFIQYFSKITGKNFVVDNRVKGKVTIISPSKISLKEAYKVFQSVLEINGFTTVKSGEIIKIITEPEARTKNVETLYKDEARPSEDKIVTQLIPLKYADPNEIKRLFAPLVSKNSIILSYPPTNTLIITDVYSNVKRLINILESIDIIGIGQEITVIPLEYADCTKLSKTLEAIFQSNQRKLPKPEVGDNLKLVADERTNSIVVLASKEFTLKIKKLITLLDQETPRGTGKIHVYYCENAKAEELAKVLQEVPTKEGTAAVKKGPVNKAPVISGDVRISADKATNSLIIIAEKDDFLVLRDIIKKLDIPRAMVYIECLIMEVNVDKEFKVGTEWIAMGDGTYKGKAGGYGGGFSGAGDSGYSNIAGVVTPNAAGVGSLPPGFSLGVFAEAIQIGNVYFPNVASIINAFKKDKDVNILSTPQILTTDNEEAKIYAGKNIPYLTKSGSSTVESYNTYEYKDVGITLKITPSISKDRSVRLQISQEVTKLDELSSTAGDRPTTLKRTIDTTVIAKDKNTVVIGGLIDDSFSKTEYKVPCIGDIPGFGWLFKALGKSSEKTNLFVFLSPHVIENPEEANEIFESKKNSISKIREENIKLYGRGRTEMPQPFVTPDKNTKPETKPETKMEMDSNKKNDSSVDTDIEKNLESLPENTPETPKATEKTTN